MVVGAGFRWVNELHAVKGERGGFHPSACLPAFFGGLGARLGGSRDITRVVPSFFFFSSARENWWGIARNAPQEKHPDLSRGTIPENGEFTKHLAKKCPCLPEPSIQIRKAPVLGYWTRTTVLGV